MNKNTTYQPGMVNNRGITNNISITIEFVTFARMIGYKHFTICKA